MNKIFKINFTSNDKKFNLEWTTACEDDDAEIIRLCKCLIELSRKGESQKIDFDSISARRQWEDGEHETIINVFYEENQIVFFTAVYNCVTFNFEYVSEVIPA